MKVKDSFLSDSGTYFDERSLANQLRFCYEKVYIFDSDVNGFLGLWLRSKQNG